MGSRGDCFDNAVAESFFATLKKELIHRRSWPTKAELRTEVFDYIEVFYNRQRRHSTLGDLSPAEYENEHSEPPGCGSRRFAARVPITNQVHYTNSQPPRPPNHPVSTEPGELQDRPIARLMAEPWRPRFGARLVNGLSRVGCSCV